MTRWFSALPIHRKLVVTALAVSSAAVAAAVVGLLVFDIARFRATAADDARAFADLIAANSAAAIVFDDAQAARQMLDSAQVRPLISQACVYRADGTSLAAYVRPGAQPCPAVASDAQGWRAVARHVPVVRAGRTIGTVYVERQLTDLPRRIIVTTSVAVVMLLVAAAVAFGLAHRIQQVISKPIVALANAARAVGVDGYKMPTIVAPPDETGALVAAFSDMVHRLEASNAERDRLLVREREASRLKDEFLAAVSHELRTPLNAILGWSQILERTHPNEQTIAKAIASVSRNARAQSRVIEDLLDISRMISGKLQLTLTAMDLGAALESAVETIAPVALAKRVQIDVRAAEGPYLIQGDFDRVRQVFWNLLSNAVKFTPAGGRVAASIAAVSDDYMVSVTDSGVGIAPSFLPYVFDRFRQADGSTTREHGGLGLGLAIVKELTERHNGTVSATSAGRGHGATFKVTFPRLIHTSVDHDRSSSSPPLNVSRLDGVSVLAIDDNADALDIVASVLTSVGARVRTSASPVQALKELERERPEIVLCDLAMPTMDGFAVLNRIRAMDAGRAPLPVIAVTAYASDEYRERCRRAGFQSHVSKPYDPQELVRSVMAVLARV